MNEERICKNCKYHKRDKNELDYGECNRIDNVIYIEIKMETFFAKHIYTNSDFGCNAFVLNQENTQ